MSAGAIIPCYNVKREYISGVLDSVLAQTFEDYEVILVDDGSLEEYRKSLEDAAQMDRRIRMSCRKTVTGWSPTSSARPATSMTECISGARHTAGSYGARQRLRPGFRRGVSIGEDILWNLALLKNTRNQRLGPYVEQAPWDLLSKRRKDLSVPGSAISSRF